MSRIVFHRLLIFLLLFVYSFSLFHYFI